MTLTLTPIHYFLIESILILGSILAFCYLKRLHFFIIAIIGWGGYLVARFTTTNHYSTQIGFVSPPNQKFQNLTIKETNNTIIDYHPLPHSYHLVINGTCTENLLITQFIKSFDGSYSSFGFTSNKPVNSLTLEGGTLGVWDNSNAGFQPDFYDGSAGGNFVKGLFIALTVIAR